MNVIDLMLYLLLFALICWLINTLITLPAPLKIILNIFLALIVLGWLLHALGYSSSLFPQLRFR